jgi:UDP-3-O-[3-hydroxymyristoyl] glucosamine N-acyltransferase
MEGKGMKASTILKSMDGNLDVECRGEIEFDYMGLSSSVYEGVLCTFIDNEKYMDAVLNRSAVILTTPEIAERYGVPAVIVDQPRYNFFRMHNFLARSSQHGYARKAFPTVIGQDSDISRLASISSENVVIGDRVTSEEFVSVKANAVIKDDAIIRAGSVIGGEGFQQMRGDGGVMAVIHAGGVVIGSHVEIQQNVCIDKAVYPWDNTILGDGCKLDNQIHIAHAVKIGRETLMAASTFVGGRVGIGEKAWIGASATISNNINVGDFAKVSIGAVVTKDVGPNQRVSGNFAIDHGKFLAFIKGIR